MFEVDEVSGDIKLRQGDSGVIHVHLRDIHTGENYTLYMAIQDSDRNPIGTEIFTPTNGEEWVELPVPKELTDLLVVPKDKEYETYLYGLKLCDSTGFERTLRLGNKENDEDNTMDVYPKKVEGE